MPEHTEANLADVLGRIDFPALCNAASLAIFQQHNAVIAEAYEGFKQCSQRRNRSEIVQLMLARHYLLAVAVKTALTLLAHQPLASPVQNLWMEEWSRASNAEGSVLLSAPFNKVLTELVDPGYCAARSLLGLLSDFLMRYDSWLSAEQPAQLESVRLRVAHELVASGLLGSLASLCDILTPAVKALWWQQEQYGSIKLQAVTAVIVSDMAQLTVSLLHQWPGKWFTGKTLAPVLPLLLGLLVAVSRASHTQAATNTPQSSNSTEEQYVASSKEPVLKSAAQTVLDTANTSIMMIITELVTSMMNELKPFAQSAESDDFDSSTLPVTMCHILQVPALQRLTLMAVAGLTKELYSRKQGERSGSSAAAAAAAAAGGSSSSHEVGQTQQQQQHCRVLAAHCQLNGLPGVQGNIVVPGHIVTKPLQATMFGLVTVAVDMLAIQMALQNSTISSNDDRAAASAQQQQQHPLVSPSTVVALLMTLIEVVQLTPPPPDFIEGLLYHITRLWNLLDYLTIKPAAAARLSGSPAAAAAIPGLLDAASRAVQQLVGPVLLHLTPAVTEAVQRAAAAAGPRSGSSSSSSSSGGSSEWGDISKFQDSCMKQLTRIISSVIHTAPFIPMPQGQSSPLIVAYRQNPVTTLSSLEAGLRCLTAEAADRADPADDFMITLVTPYMDTVKIFLMNVAQLHLATGTGDVAEQQQLVSLAATLLKCCRRLQSADRPIMWQLVGIITSVLEASCSFTAAAAGRADADKAMAPWFATIGNYLTVFGQFVVRQIVTGTDDDVHAASLVDRGAWLILQTSMHEVTSAVSLLQSQLTEHVLVGESAAVAATLQEQAATLQDKLQDARDDWEEHLQEHLQELAYVPPASVVIREGSVRGLFKAGCGVQGVLAQQLADFGAAVCAAVPVAPCCNNMGCRDVSGFSEMELVITPACICGGCRVARYCGRECQAAHWQQHKAACKRIKKVPDAACMQLC